MGREVWVSSIFKDVAVLQAIVIRKLLDSDINLHLNV